MGVTISTISYPCAVKVTTPLLQQGARANWSMDSGPDGAFLTFHIPNLGATVEVALFGEHLDTFLKVTAAEVRKARKAQLKAVTA